MCLCRIHPTWSRRHQGDCRSETAGAADKLSSLQAANVKAKAACDNAASAASSAGRLAAQEVAAADRAAAAASTRVAEELKAAEASLASLVTLSGQAKEAARSWALAEQEAALRTLADMKGISTDDGVEYAAKDELQRAFTAAEAHAGAGGALDAALEAVRTELSRLAKSRTEAASAMKAARAEVSNAARAHIIHVSEARAAEAKAAEQEEVAALTLLQNAESGRDQARAATIAKRDGTVDSWRAVQEPLARVGLTPHLILEYDKGEHCSFWFLKAEMIKDYQGTTLPKLQDIRRDHLDWLEQRTVSFKDGCAGLYRDSILAVSHCWEDISEPDKEGSQFSALKRHLHENPQIKLVWIDYCGTSTDLLMPPFFPVV